MNHVIFLQFSFACINNNWHENVCDIILLRNFVHQSHVRENKFDFCIRIGYAPPTTYIFYISYKRKFRWFRKVHRGPWSKAKMKNTENRKRNTKQCQIFCVLNFEMGVFLLSSREKRRKEKIIESHCCERRWFVRNMTKICRVRRNRTIRQNIIATECESFEICLFICANIFQ